MRGFAPHWLKLAALALAASPVAACRAEAPAEAAVTAPLALTGRVVDAAGILTAAQEAEITTLLTALERDTRVQFVVASTPNLEGEDIKTYSLRLANGWGLGDRERNDGLLLLVAPNDRKVRISTGLGLEKQLTDADCEEIVAQMLPLYQTGDLAGGTLSGARLLDSAVRAKVRTVS